MMSHRVACIFVPRVAFSGTKALARIANCNCRCHILSCPSSGKRSYVMTVTHRLPFNRIISSQNLSAAYVHSPHDWKHSPQTSSYFKSKFLLGASVCAVELRNKIVIRGLHTSSLLYKEESKVEKSVKALKDQTVPPPTPEDVPSDVVVKKTLWHRFVAELKHYYHGFRLLYNDIKICCRLLWSVLNGKSLSRREHRQLVRTTADLFRLVPFLVFLLIPFAEFLLPVVVKLFPNMLPSTFAEENKEQEKLKKQLKMKLEMAKFLQDTIHESALQRKEQKGENVQEFSNFMNKIRSEGFGPTTEEIMKFSKLFEDEITLDNLSHAQLQALCRVLSVQPIGTDTFLRFQLNMKLRQLKTDDKMIQKEGIDSLSINELQSACRARGMRALGVSEQRLKLQLEQWLQLHLHEKVPTSLLLLSRALYLPDTLPTSKQLEATISTLPETTTEEAKLKIAELTGDKVDNRAKLELIKHEEEVIKKEKEEQKEEEEEEKVKQQEREEAEAVAAETAMAAKETLHDEALILESRPAEELKDTRLADAVAAEQEEEKITSKDLEEIESALEEIAEQKKLNIEKEELQDLKEEVEEYKEDLEDLKDVIVASGGKLEDLGESKAANRLVKKVGKMISQLDDIIGELHKEKDKFQEEIEVTEVRMKHSKLRDDEKKMEELIQQIHEGKDNIISINEMLLALKRLQKTSDESRLQRILEVLDEDQDGIIDVSHVLKVIETLGRENIKLSASQVTEMMELLKREIELEEEEKRKEKEEKEQQKHEQEAQG